jgi:hypothetical protein
MVLLILSVVCFFSFLPMAGVIGKVSGQAVPLGWFLVLLGGACLAIASGLRMGWTPLTWFLLVGNSLLAICAGLYLREQQGWIPKPVAPHPRVPLGIKEIDEAE